MGESFVDCGIVEEWGGKRCGEVETVEVVVRVVAKDQAGPYCELGGAG